MASISGTVTVAGDPDDWIACAFDADTHAYAGSAAVSAGAYEITGLTAGKAYMIACRCKTGGAWVASKDDYILGDYAIPSSPETIPYIYKITAPEGAQVISARYWRIKGFVTSEGGLKISEIQLHNNSGNQNGSATITGTEPWYGSFASIKDNDLNTNAYWITASTTYFHWDFGASIEISGVMIGAADVSFRFPSQLLVEYSSNNTDWTTQTTITGISYPGNVSYTPLLNIQSVPITGSSEPTWPTTPGNTVEDGDFTWTNMGRLVQPLIQGPLIAAD